MGSDRKFYFVDSSYLTPNLEGDFSRVLYDIRYFTDFIKIPSKLEKWEEYLHSMNAFSRRNDCYTVSGVAKEMDALIEHLNNNHRWHNRDQLDIQSKKLDRIKREGKRLEKIRKEMLEAAYEIGEEIEGLSSLNSMVRSIRDIFRNLTVYHRKGIIIPRILSSKISETDYSLVEAALDCVRRRETNEAVILTEDNHLQRIWEFYLSHLNRQQKEELSDRLEIRLEQLEL